MNPYTVDGTTPTDVNPAYGGISNTNTYLTVCESEYI